jgi:hypothetical protein
MKGSRDVWNARWFLARSFVNSAFLCRDVWRVATVTVWRSACLCRLASKEAECVANREEKFASQTSGTQWGTERRGLGGFGGFKPPEIPTF